MTAAFNIEDLARPDLKGLQPYEAHYAPGVIRLDANENPHDFPQEARDYIMSRVGPQFFGRYPDPLARDLVSDLAAHYGLGAENLMVGNGSDEIILNIMLAFGAGRKVFIAAPTFSMYGIHARVAGAVPVEVPRGPEFEVDVEAMVRAGGREPGVMVVCNPNNPTGNATDPADIEALARSVNSLLVVDEAYIEFGGESCVPLLGKYPNLAIMRTFSKAFGLAGLRLGYLLAGPAVIRELMRIKQPFNVNSFTQLAGRSVIRFRDLFEAPIRRIVAGRDRLARRLRELPGVTVYPSVANFLLIRTNRAAYEVYRLLLDGGVLVRHLNLGERGEFLRVTVGTERENDIFIARLKTILDGPGTVRA
ncbi:MAG: histidinol-phosphate transaminase [Peptococcaceae bacterium]|nr:histidinol-phosphate transaminase [Peptococcaceae bacterium]